MGDYRTETATDLAGKQLAEIRVDAMRPSLEAVGRFDADRARDRFLRSFNPQETEIIYLNDSMVRFYVVRRNSDHFYLDHLYVVPRFQGQGIGQRVMDVLKENAQSHGFPIKLMALNGSPANEFYLQCGFRFVSTDDLDTVYEWQPELAANGS